MEYIIAENGDDDSSNHNQYLSTGVKGSTNSDDTESVIKNQKKIEP